MQWLNEPSSWQRTGDVITVNVDPGTDFWRETGYGYIRDSGHVYGELLGGDLDVSARVRGNFAGQYDQAGIMLRVDARLWLKTGMEFFEGRARLSTVLTLGKSSWTVTDLPEGTDEIRLRASRRGDAVEIRYMVGDGPAELAALLFLPAGREVLAGVMCAAPEGPGFGVTFSELRIDDREWPEDGEGQAAGAWAAGPDREDAEEGQPSWAYQPAGNAGFQWLDDAPDDTEPEWVGEPAGDAGAEEPAFAAGQEEPAFAAGQEEPAFAAVAGAPGPGTPDGGEAGAGELGSGEPAAGEPGGGESDGPGGHDGGAEPQRRGRSHGDTRTDWSGQAAGEGRPNDAAADWDRLAAFARTRPWAREPASDVGDSWPGPPLTAAAPRQRTATGERGEPAASPAEQPGDASNGGEEEGEPPRAGDNEPSQDTRAAAEPGPRPADATGGHREELPESIADDETNPDMPAAAGPRAHRRSLRKKAPADLAAPVDPADEWISLLTADD